MTTATRICMLGVVFLGFAVHRPAVAQSAAASRPGAANIRAANWLRMAGPRLPLVPPSWLGKPAEWPMSHERWARAEGLAGGAVGTWPQDLAITHTPPTAAPGTASPLAASPNAERTVVKVTERDLNGDGTIDRRFTTSTTYDPHGNVVRIDDGETGTTTNNTYNQRGILMQHVEETAYSRYEWSVVEFDQRGNPVRVVQQSETDGVIDYRATYTYAYDERGNVVKIVWDVDSAARFTWTYTYDQPVRLVYLVYEVDVGIDGTIEARETQATTYDQRGNVLRMSDEFDDGVDGSIDIRYGFAYSYDQRGNLVQQVSEYLDYRRGFSGFRTTTTNTYDPRGSLVRQVEDLDDGADGTIELRLTTTDAYDARGSLLQQVTEGDRGANGTIDGRETMTDEYDPRGDLVRQVTETDNGADGTVNSRETATFEYDGPPPRARALASLDAAAAAPAAGSRSLLQGAAPNPFRDLTAIHYVLPQPGRVDLRIYDAGGRLVRTLADGVDVAGEHRAVWDGRDQSARPVPGGAYFARLRVGDREESRVLLRVW